MGKSSIEVGERTLDRSSSVVCGVSGDLIKKSKGLIDMISSLIELIKAKEEIRKEEKEEEREGQGGPHPRLTPLFTISSEWCSQMEEE